MIITADIHLHTFKAFVDKKSEMNSRLLNTLFVMDQILDYAIKTNDRQIIIIGDTFETKNMVEAITNNHFSDWVAKCKQNSVHLTILVGNHDISSLGDERITLLHPLKYFENVTLINESIMIPFAGGTLSFVPFRRNQDVCREMINNVMVQAKKHNEGSVDQQFNFLFYHGAVLGAKISNREFLDEALALSVEDLHPEFFDQVFLGHFHKHQKLADNVRYVGAPLHHDLNDAGDQRGFYQYDITENKLKFIKTAYPAFIKLEIESNEDWAKYQINDTDYYTILVNEETTVSQNLYSKSNVKILKTNKKAKQQRLEIEYNVGEKLNPSKLVDTYVTYITKDKTTFDVERLKKLGRDILHETTYI